MAEAPLPSPFRLDAGDIAAWVNAQGLRRRFGQPPDWLWFLLGAANLALGLYALFGLGFWQAVWSWLSLGIAAFAFAAPAMNRAYCRLVLRRSPAVGLDVVLGWGMDGLDVRYGEVEDDLPFAAIRRVDERPEHLLFWLDARRAFIVPKRAFEDGQDASRFAEAVRAGMLDR